MFCSKCGKEILNEAVICPNCGCATNNYHTHISPQPQSISSSADYMAITQFYEHATTLRNLGIVAAILMFGIGIIFSIIIWVKAKSIQIPEVQTTNPQELAQLETAKHRYKTANTLASLPIFGIALGFMLGGMIGMFMNM